MSNKPQSNENLTLNFSKYPVHEDPSGLVVGAGSTGLITAALMAPTFKNILIYELAPEIGGVTKDIEGPGKKTFYAGCQYLLPEYLPPDYDFSSLSTFSHRYGSITKINDDWLFKNDFAGPSFPESWFEFDKVVEVDAINFENLSLERRVSLYPPQIQNYLRGFFTRIFPNESLDTFSSSSASSLGISRVTTLQNEMELVQKKNKSAVWDQLYGVTRSSLGIKFETAAVPKFGYSNFWFEFFEQIQQKTKITLELGVKVNRASSMHDNRIVRPTAKVWTADPRFPVRHFTRSRLESKTTKRYLTGISVLEYEGPSAPYYINIFSSEETLTRIYIYELQGEYRITLESLSPFADVREVRNELMPHLESAQMRARIPTQEVWSNLRRHYFPMSSRDNALINQAEQEMYKFGWRKSGMHLSDRTSRLQVIKASLEEDQPPVA